MQCHARIRLHSSADTYAHLVHAASFSLSSVQPPTSPSSPGGAFSSFSRTMTVVEKETRSLRMAGIIQNVLVPFGRPFGERRFSEVRLFRRTRPFSLLLPLRRCAVWPISRQYEDTPWCLIHTQIVSCGYVCVRTWETLRSTEWIQGQFQEVNEQCHFFVLCTFYATKNEERRAATLDRCR